MSNRPNWKRLRRLLAVAAAGGSLAAATASPAAHAVDATHHESPAARIGHPGTTHPATGDSAARGEPRESVHRPAPAPEPTAPEPADPEPAEPSPDPEPTPAPEPEPPEPPLPLPDAPPATPDHPPAVDLPSDSAADEDDSPATTPPTSPPEAEPPPAELPSPADVPEDGAVDPPSSIADPVTPIIEDLAPPPDDSPPPPDNPDSEEKATTPRRTSADDDAVEDADVPPEPDPPDVTEPAPPEPAPPAFAPPPSLRVDSPESVALGSITPDTSPAETESAMEEVVVWIGDQNSALDPGPDLPGDPMRIVAALDTSGDSTRQEVSEAGVPLFLPTSTDALHTVDGGGHIDRVTSAWTADPDAGQARILRHLAAQAGTTPPSRLASERGWDVLDAGAGDSDLGGTIDSLFRDS